MAKTKRGKSRGGGHQGRGKTRKKAQTSSRKINWGPNVTRRQRGRDRLIIGIIVVAVLVGGGFFFWNQNRATRAFDELAASGARALDRVRTEPLAGNDHLPLGQRYTYLSQFPTSGPHDTRPIRAGFYEEAQWPERLVHSQEHGHIVIYYDQLDPADRETIRAWTNLFTGQWDGVVATPMPGIGRRVVLVAWGRLLRLRGFDAAEAAAFIDAYRGRGPEQRVR